MRRVARDSFRRPGILTASTPSLSYRLLGLLHLTNLLLPALPRPRLGLSFLLGCSSFLLLIHGSSLHYLNADDLLVIVTYVVSCLWFHLFTLFIVAFEERKSLIFM